MSNDRGPVHELDAGLYRAVIREGVPMIERDNQASAVTAVLIPVAPPFLSVLTADWSAPLRVRVENGEFVFSKPEAVTSEVTQPNREKAS